VVKIGTSKISGCKISLQAAVHPGALATGTQPKKMLLEELCASLKYGCRIMKKGNAWIFCEKKEHMETVNKFNRSKNTFKIKVKSPLW
jgi:hypothetical protein